MPGFDRTGPGGQGSRTGWRMGKCKPDPKKENDFRDDAEQERGFGWFGGRGRGSGKGRGRGNGPGLGRRNRFGWGRRND